MRTTRDVYMCMYPAGMTDSSRVVLYRSENDARLWDAARALAKVRKQSMSAFVREAVRAYVRRGADALPSQLRDAVNNGGV